MKKIYVNIMLAINSIAVVIASIKKQILGGILTIVGMLLVITVGLVDIYAFPLIIRVCFAFIPLTCLFIGLDLLIPDRKDDDDDEQNAGPLAY